MSEQNQQYQQEQELEQLRDCIEQWVEAVNLSQWVEDGLQRQQVAVLVYWKQPLKL